MTPSLNWDSRDLKTEFKKFKTHAEFMFGGPLNKKNEEEKLKYLMLWFDGKGKKGKVKTHLSVMLWVGEREKSENTFKCP